MKGNGAKRRRIFIWSVVLGGLAALVPLFVDLGGTTMYLVAVTANVVVANLFAKVLFGGAKR
ncbi:hypothetical protein [Lentzea sp. NBRC 102530]|uniref:hypothetical protein n=1 Tax=Lentzea sp. NBRC 102530 TaxID=3032201 RepID=UPI0024A4152E|nr:hypothetical protein [Lentzea sp. NBRC 102530]GLY55191.1 hypothetical protein Lesp01_88460 [Lentzea sp. NBRC 102530]